MGSFYVAIRNAELSDLVAAAQANENDDSFEMNEIIVRFNDLAVALARALTPDRDLREDLANAARLALVSAVRKHAVGCAGFPNYAKAYMAGAAKRELGKWLSSSNASDSPQLGTDDKLDAGVLYSVATRQAPVADRTWGSGNTAHAVDRLKPDQQTLLELRFIDDLDIASIASLSNTSNSAVSQRIGTALRSFERELVTS